MKLQGDGMESSDFDKCGICINCKIKHKQDNNKKKIVDFGFRTTISSLLFKKISPMCMCAIPTEPRSHLEFM